MKKIITGILGIVATIAVVGGIAYAATFGQVDATASATTTNDLLISTDNATFGTTVDLSTGAFNKLTTVGNTQNLYFEDQTKTATTGLTIQQTGTLTDPNAIAGDVQVAFADGVNKTTPDTAWQSLTVWGTAVNVSGIAIPANASASHAVTMFVRLNPSTPSAGNASYSVTGINFTFGPLY